MKELQLELLLNAKQGMLTSLGEESLHEEEITDVANVIIASIAGGAWAVMDEWGTGSLMDPTNPALDEYKSSSLWNPARHDHKIRTRPKGPYTNIFGKQVESKAPVAGVDLERFNIIFPSPPSHAVQTAARWMKNGRMRSAIQSTIAAFPFSKFIITDTK